MVKTEFPWELLKAECLRLVCTQLLQGHKDGGSYQGLGRKDDMVDFLRDVNQRGLELAFETLEETRAPRKPVSSSPSKRKSSRLEEANDGESDGNYNTRYKGLKRVRLTQEDDDTVSTFNSTRPRKAGRGRKSAPEGNKADKPSARRVSARKSTEQASAHEPKRGRGRPKKTAPETETETESGPEDDDEYQSSDSPPVKRGRGRPKKSITRTTQEEEVEEDEEEAEMQEEPKRGRGRPKKAAKAEGKKVNQEKPKRGRGRPSKTAGSAPASKTGKEIFDGVLLKKRKANHPANPNGDVSDEEVVENGAQERGDEEVDEEDAVLAVVNGHILGDASSLGESNKENDPNDFAADIEVDADADGDRDPDAEGDAEVAA